jgi:hypothetical protein
VDDNIVTLLSDLSMKEIRVLSSDIQECTEVTSGRLELGSYELHDLVQIGSSVGIIVKIERDSFRILDTGGHVQTVLLQEMGNKRNNKNATSFDGHRNPVVQNDMVAVVDGLHKGRNGVVKHVYRYNAFVYCKEVLENGGIIVVKCAHLNLLGGKKKNGPINVPLAPRPQVFLSPVPSFLDINSILIKLLDPTPLTPPSVQQRHHIAARWYNGSWRAHPSCAIRPLLPPNHHHYEGFVERLPRDRQGNY